MINLPPSPFTDSGVAPSAPDDAASLPHSHAPGEAAEINEQRFVLDVARFLAEIEPPPLFLREARYASR